MILRIEYAGRFGNDSDANHLGTRAKPSDGGNQGQAEMSALMALRQFSSVVKVPKAVALGEYPIVTPARGTSKNSIQITLVHRFDLFSALPSLG